MLKKMHGKTRQLKSSVVKLVTVFVPKPSKPVKSTKVTVSNSITSDTTVVEVWIMFGLLLSLGMQTGLGNRNAPKE